MQVVCLHGGTLPTQHICMHTYCPIVKFKCQSLTYNISVLSYLHVIAKRFIFFTIVKHDAFIWNCFLHITAATAPSGCAWTDGGIIWISVSHLGSHLDAHYSLEKWNIGIRVGPLSPVPRSSLLAIWENYCVSSPSEAKTAYVLQGLEYCGNIL